jgi:tRNA pseudouridine38-40 synthase
MVGERRRFRATLAYDGTAYQGFQRQAGGAPTIQGEVEAAIARITGQAVTVIGAGRTDTGVHATGQVIAFDLVWPHEAVQLMNAINAHLPPDIALQDIAQHEGFHPRFDALTRLYSYYILPVRQRFPMHRSRTWQLRAPLDAAAMQAAAALLVGRHDFAAFGQAPSGENTVRTVIRSGWEEVVDWDGTTRLLVYRIEADAFLKHMVRRIVGALVDVGMGRSAVDALAESFARAKLMPKATVAPPQGLVLECVTYPSPFAETLAPGMQVSE